MKYNNRGRNYKPNFNTVVCSGGGDAGNR